MRRAASSTEAPRAWSERYIASQAAVMYSDLVLRFSSPPMYGRSGSRTSKRCSVSLAIASPSALP